METRKFESDIGKGFLPLGKDLHHQQIITSDMISENVTRIPQYSQISTTRTNQARSVNPQGTSPGVTIVRLPAKNRSLDRSQLKSPNITILQRELVNTKSPREVGNQYISLPLRIENLSGNLQLVAAKPGSTRGQTSLIPVVVSGDEIYQFQGQGTQKNVVLLTSSPSTQSASSANQNFNLTGSVCQTAPSATAIGSQNISLTGLLSQPAQSATAIGNQNLNLTGLLSQPAHSATAIGNQNLNLTGLLATTSKLEAGLTTPVTNIQTGFHEAQHLNSYDHIVNSSPIMTGSVFSNRKASVTQTVSSPVYKSKLEKAMAQNLLIQSSAKNTRNKTLTVPVMSQKSATIQTQPAVEPEANPIRPDPYSNQRVTQEHIEEPALQFLTNPTETANSTSPVKPALKVSKVAEYYKSLVASKGIQYTEKQTYLQPQMGVTAQSVTDNCSQYTIIADPESLHMNPKITDVFSIGQNTPGNSIEFETMNNSEFAYSALHPLSCFPVEQPEFVIREKRYEDYNMGRSILEMLWSLREENLFCDAILYAGSQEIRLHKVVLIGASPEIHKRVFKTLDQELKLMLPCDISVDSIMTFVYYIYHGVVKLTQENVQHLYRLSGIFGMTQLSKHCYDFCKVAKMGHLIIGSPYQEAAKQIQKETTSPEALHSSRGENQFPVPIAINTSSDMFIPPKLFTRSKPLPAKKENRDTLETISQEIDWINNDPSQSNIPIRKRGRNRKAVQNEAVRSIDNEVVKKLEHEIYNQNFNTDARNVAEVGESNIGNRYVHPKKSEASKFGISPFETAYEIFIENDLDGKNTEAGHSLNKETVMSDRKGKQAQAIEDFLESLPDPLVTGKLDESELLKLKEIDDKSEKNEMKKLVVSHTVNRPVMTRFRTRSANISVVEAAAQMKAKSNDMSRLSTPKNRRKRAAKKTSPNVMESSDHPSSEIQRLLSNPARSLLVEDNMTIDDEKNLMINTSPAYGHDSLTVKFSENSASAITITKELTDMNPVTSVKEADSKNIDMPEQDSQKKRGGTAEGTELNDSLFNYLTAPKKARLRKSTLDQHDLKDTVYMRPPPKKRAKEIREMMRNEEDGKLNDDKTITDGDRKFDPNEVEKENASRAVKTKKKRPRVKNDIVMAKVYEIEKFAMAIESEKIYRCTFCSVEFKFAKRAVTHLIGTHDIELDDTPDYVSVEKKTEDCKELHECDICGFKPKESGTYYIHYHKYFRHQIPLPKGWQAFKCDLCQKEFFTKFQLREHKLIHFEDNPFVCELCGSGFRSRTCLNSHVFHKHSSVRKHKCPECPKTFKTATQVKVHQRVHSGEKPFLCPTENCMYRSTTRGNMKLHLSSKHKLVPSTVKTLMEELEASEAGPESLIYADDSFNQEANKEIYQGDSTVEAGDFGILVQSSSLDNGNVTSNREPYVTGQIEILNDTNVMVSSYSETVPENNPIVLNTRDYSLVNQGAVPNPDLDMVMPGDNHILEGQNIPRHVEMLIQDAHRFMQHQDNSGQSQFSVSDFQQNSENEILDMRNRLPDQSTLVQTYENPGSSGTSRYIDTPQVHGTHKVLDPHSKEARLMIREAFEGHAGRSLLKSAILQGNQDSHRLEIGTRHLAENANISESANLLNEAEKLVIDLHESSNHQIAGSINPEDEVVQRLRSQIQQIRDSNEQFRDSNSAPLFRTDHSVPEILLQSITSQHQTMEPAHFQTYHHSTGSPPAYSSSSHGLITLPVSDIATQSNVTLTPVSQDETQGQIHSLQSVAVMQGQGYPPVTSQSSTNQFTPDSGMYQGYYQEQYDIENY